jgi:hypothetical protein
VKQRALYIADAERAAIRATDLLLALPDRDASKLGSLLTVPRGDSWYALFGKLGGDGRFVPGYAFRAYRAAPERMEALDVKALPGSFDAEARAVSASVRRAHEAFGRGQLNPVVYAEEGQLSVYVMQGFSERDVYVLGGDFRFDFSPDGRQLQREVQLHQSIHTVDMRSEEMAGAAGGMHTHLLTAGPAETEWATLMLYPRMGVLGVRDRSGWLYILSPDGSVEVQEPRASED